MPLAFPSTSKRPTISWRWPPKRGKPVSANYGRAITGLSLPPSSRTSIIPSPVTVKTRWHKNLAPISTKSSIHLWSPVSACPADGRSRSAFYFLRADAVFVVPFARPLPLRRNQRKILLPLWIEYCGSMSSTVFTSSCCSTKISATFHRMPRLSSSY